MKKIVVIFLLLFSSVLSYSTTLTVENLRKELNIQNVPYPEIVIAQSIIETGYFKSKLCVKYNNILGLRTKKGYKHYNSWKDCVADYKKLISSRYKGGNYYSFLVKIKYASDKTYIKKLKLIV